MPVDALVQSPGWFNNPLQLPQAPHRPRSTRNPRCGPETPSAARDRLIRRSSLAGHPTAAARPPAPPDLQFTCLPTPRRSHGSAAEGRAHGGLAARVKPATREAKRKAGLADALRAGRTCIAGPEYGDLRWPEEWGTWCLSIRPSGAPVRRQEKFRGLLGTGEQPWDSGRETEQRTQPARDPRQSCHLDPLGPAAHWNPPRLIDQLQRHVGRE